MTDSKRVTRNGLAAALREHADRGEPPCASCIAATPPASGDVDAAWDALAADLPIQARVRKYRPLIEAAIRAEGLDVDVALWAQQVEALVSWLAGHGLEERWTAAARQRIDLLRMSAAIRAEGLDWDDERDIEWHKRPGIRTTLQSRSFTSNSPDGPS